MDVIQSNVKRIALSCLLFHVVLSWSASLVVALHVDEANITDFHITTCGHGTVSSAINIKTPNNNVMISSGNMNKCYICSRDVTNGDVLWRRNVCTNNNDSTNVALHSNKGIYSISEGVVKRWNELGNVINEEYYENGNSIFIDETTEHVVITTNDNKLLIVNRYLQKIHEINLVDALSKYGKVRNPKNFDGKIVLKAVNNGYFVLLVDSNNMPAPAFMKLKEDLSIDKITSFKVSIQLESSSSFSVTKDGVVIVGEVNSPGFWLFADTFGIKSKSATSINPNWSAIQSLNLLGDYLEIKATLSDSADEIGNIGLFHVTPSGTLEFINVSSSPNQDCPVLFATSSIPNDKVLLASMVEYDDKYKILMHKLPSSGNDESLLLISSNINSNLLHPSNGKVTSMKLSCESDYLSCHILVSTSIGTTIQLSPSSSSMNIDWYQEEALGFTSNALFMDYNDHQEEESTLVAPQDKQIYFGFHKLLLLLSNKFNALFAMDTVGNDKGKILYKIPLDDADKHVLVHGNPTSKSSVHGAYFTTNTQHVTSLLLLSIYSESVQFKCLHTPSGKLTFSGEQLFHKEKVITNIYPFWDENNEYCKQSALLLFNDNTMQIVPESSTTKDHISSILSKSNSKDGMYFHEVNKNTGNIQCQKLNADQKLEVTGQTTINPDHEIIKSTHYPLRNEVVQTPTTILGDDSLLIKYLNPHIMVIVTELTPDYLSELENEEENEFFNAVMSNDGASSTSTKKKPLGVTPTNATTTTSNTQSSIPSLFVTIVDTTSCRILHRASHSHATSKNAPSNSIIPLTISENWIVYSYFNHKSKRTELSVLTLYEGMIDKHGITAFNTPDQELQFDSFTFPKPIVLQKTYAVPSKSITSIGVTTTSRGITSKNFIFSLGDWIWKVDSRMLDPRRPTGELKTIEKMEGLVRYSPLLPVISSHVISYNLHIENPTSIISTSARLESQSLVFAYGGPDLFFTRLAPSKGFDLLPDNFNKSLVGTLTVGLFGVLLHSKKMSDRRILKAAWA